MGAFEFLSLIVVGGRNISPLSWLLSSFRLVLILGLLFRSLVGLRFLATLVYLVTFFFMNISFLMMSLFIIFLDIVLFFHVLRVFATLLAATGKLAQFVEVLLLASLVPLLGVVVLLLLLDDVFNVGNVVEVLVALLFVHGTGLVYISLLSVVGLFNLFLFIVGLFPFLFDLLVSVVDVVLDLV